MPPLAPTLELPHGARMPRLGLGTWPMGDREAERVVAEAIGLGYRLIDTAHAYGNEGGVGRGMRASGVAARGAVRHHQAQRASGTACARPARPSR